MRYDFCCFSAGLNLTILMKKQLGTLFWGLFLFSLSASGQIVRVTDAVSGEPLELVTIASEGPRASTITNSKGEAELSEFRGASAIEFRMVGYNPLVLSYDQVRGTGFRIALSRSRVNLDEVVVAASRWSQKTSEIPVKVTSIPRSAVQLHNPQTAADMLGISGKVFIQKSQQGGGSPMIRGFATNRLLYAVDGVRMNTAIFRGGNIQNVISLDPFAIEQTEVLFGPGSVIYGSDAIGGVMSFRTLTPRFSLDEKPHISGNANTRFSTANMEKTGHLDFNVGWRKWALLTSFTVNDYGDLRMGSHGPEIYERRFYVKRVDIMDVVVANDDVNLQIPSAYRQWNLMQKVHIIPGPGWDLEYGFHYSTTSAYARYDRHIRYRNGLPRYAQWDYGPQEWMMNHLAITHTTGKLLYEKATLRLAHQRFGESRITRDMNASDREVRTERVDAWSANLDLTKPLGKKHRLVYGMEAVHNGVDSRGRITDILSGAVRPGPSRYPESSWSSYALYITDQYEATGNITLQGGLRYTRFQLSADFDTTFYPFPFTSATIRNGALTGSAGLVYRPGNSWVLSTNLATAFRSPNVDDMGKVFDSEPGSVTVPNPRLKAEYAYNIDAGVARVFNGFVKIDLSGYYTLLQNAMVRRDYALGGMDTILYDGVPSRVQAVQNAARARVYGIQAGAEVKLPSGFTFTSDFNWQRGQEELDDGSVSPSRHAPPWFGFSRVTYSRGKLEMQLYAQYSGGKTHGEMPEEEKGKAYLYALDSNGNPYSPGWYTVNMKASYQPTGYLSVSAGLENITDQRYRPYSSGICAAGRNFIVSVRVHI